MAVSVEDEKLFFFKIITIKINVDSGTYNTIQIIKCTCWNVAMPHISILIEKRFRKEIKTIQCASLICNGAYIDGSGENMIYM